MKKVMYISSTGGHFTELMQLKKVIDSTSYYIVTESTKSNKELEKKFPERISFLGHATRKNIIKYLFYAGFNIIKSFFIFMYFKPDIVISTGAHTAVPMCIIAKMLRKKVIFIETFANQNKKTLTGKILYRFADVFIVQWEEMLKFYPKAIYLGGVF